jgi:hypothetical protein
VGNRENIPINNSPNEAHDPVGRRKNAAVRRDVDTAVTGRVRRCRGNKLPHNPVVAGNRPRPVAELHGRREPEYQRGEHGQKRHPSRVVESKP